METTPAIDDNSNVYIAGGDTMASYDSNGNLRWSSTPIAGAILGESSSPSLSSDNSKVYLAADAGIFAFDAENGEVLWQKEDRGVVFILHFMSRMKTRPHCS